jgi:chromatin remodeling complex protein RSC6
MAKKKKPFGGYSISFKKVASKPIKDIFGTGALSPSEMTKKLWKFVKKHKLAKK